MKQDFLASDIDVVMAPEFPDFVTTSMIQKGIHNSIPDSNTLVSFMAANQKLSDVWLQDLVEVYDDISDADKAKNLAIAAALSSHYGSENISRTSRIELRYEWTVKKPERAEAKANSVLAKQQKCGEAHAIKRRLSAMKTEFLILFVPILFIIFCMISWKLIS